LILLSIFGNYINLRLSFIIRKMSDILINYANDVLDQISEEYNWILGKTKEETDGVKEIYKYLFATITVFTGFIIAIISSMIIGLSTGITILFFELVAVLLLLIKRQRTLRKLNEVYGDWISILGRKKDAFIKIRKNINYWEHIRADIVIKKDDFLTPKTTRNSLHALNIIDNAYYLYKIAIYEKLFQIVHTEAKADIFVSLMHKIKNSIETAKELEDITKKPLPFYIQDELNQIFSDNRKYFPQFYKESLTSSKIDGIYQIKDFDKAVILHERQVTLWKKLISNLF